MDSKIFFYLATLLLVGCSMESEEKDLYIVSERIESANQEFIPPDDGMIVTHEQAAKVAYTYFSLSFGEEATKKQLPLRVRLLDDRWLVQGTFPGPEHAVGGSAHIELSRWDGRIVSGGHSY